MVSRAGRLRGMQPMLPPQAQAGMPPQAQAGLPPQAQAGFGAGPDGMGAYLTNPGGQVLDQTATMHYWPQPQLEGQLPFLEPSDTSGRATLQSAGYTALLVALTTGIGLAYGKGWGAVAGLTIGAGAANAYRAQKWINDPDPSRRHEAVVSATVGVGELVVAIYSAWRASKAKGSS